MIDYTVIGKRIQLKRQNKGITQQKLAEKVGISVVYLKKKKNGRLEFEVYECRGGGRPHD